MVMIIIINHKRIHKITIINSNDEKSLVYHLQVYLIMALRDIGRTSRSSDRETEPVGGKCPSCSNPLRRGPGRIAAASTLRRTPRWNSNETRLEHGEHVGGDGAKPASPDHPRRALPAANLCWHVRVRRAQGGGSGTGGGRHTRASRRV